MIENQSPEQKKKYRLSYVNTVWIQNDVAGSSFVVDVRYPGGRKSYAMVQNSDKCPSANTEAAETWIKWPQIQINT